MKLEEAQRLLNHGVNVVHATPVDGDLLFVTLTHRATDDSAISFLIDPATMVAHEGVVAYEEESEPGKGDEFDRALVEAVEKAAGR